MGSGVKGLYQGTTKHLPAEIRNEHPSMSNVVTESFNEEKSTKREPSEKKVFQGGRTREEYSALARDPARGTKVDEKGKKERAIALDLERHGKLQKVTRDPQASGGADFIDGITGQKWDIKSPVSHPNGHTSVRKGAFSVSTMMDNVMKEINRGNNVVLDTRRLTKDHRAAFKKAMVRQKGGITKTWMIFKIELRHTEHGLPPVAGRASSSYWTNSICVQ